MPMVQYGLFSNCSNNCSFCLLRQKKFESMDKILEVIDEVIENISVVDWENQFSDGISLLGGELYFITDKAYQDKFMELIDVIIEKILKVSKNPNVKYSTVTNGIYDPEFLFRVIDKIKNAVGMNKIDVNFSYDIKYRYSNEESRLKVLENINKFRERYNYEVGVQMILTQYLLDAINKGEFDIQDFIKKNIPGCRINLLYPHRVMTGHDLQDFNLKREDFLVFYSNLPSYDMSIFRQFTDSVINSQMHKHTGLYYRNMDGVATQPPKLTEGKELKSPQCGHSLLYQCYQDSIKCMLCDMLKIRIDYPRSERVREVYNAGIR